MRQLKLKFSIIRALLTEIFGVTATSQEENQQPIRLYPGLLNFVSNLRTKIYLERFAEKLQKEEEFLQKKMKELATKHFGEDKENWAKMIKVPVDPEVPKKITKVLTPEVPEFIKEMGTDRDIPNPEYKTEEVDNPDYKFKEVENENWDAYKKDEEELLNTEVEVQCFPFTDSLFDIDTTFCQGVKAGTPYFRVSKEPSKSESVEQFSAPVFIKNVVLEPVDAENLKGHKYPQGDE